MNCTIDCLSKNRISNLNSELDKSRQESHLLVREMDRSLLGLPSVSNQTCDGIDEKVGRAAVTGVCIVWKIFLVGLRWLWLATMTRPRNGKDKVHPDGGGCL